MVYGLTLCIKAARARTRIHTALVDTCSIRWAIAAAQTLRTALLVRIAKVIGQTLTRTGAVLLAAHGVRTARGRLTRRARHVVRSWLFARSALDHCVTLEVGRTEAVWRVTDNVTLGRCSANAGARIGAPVADARLMVGTLGVGNAFGSAVGWCTDELGQTGARRRIADGATKRIGATR